MSWSFCSFQPVFYRVTSAAARARPPSPKNTGMKPTIVAVIPDRLLSLIAVCVTGIATATIKIVPKITAITFPPMSISLSPDNNIITVLFYKSFYFLFSILNS